MNATRYSNHQLLRCVHFIDGVKLQAKCDCCQTISANVLSRAEREVSDGKMQNLLVSYVRTTDVVVPRGNTRVILIEVSRFLLLHLG